MNKHTDTNDSGNQPVHKPMIKHARSSVLNKVLDCLWTARSLLTQKRRLTFQQINTA